MSKRESELVALLRDLLEQARPHVPANLMFRIDAALAEQPEQGKTRCEAAISDGLIKRCPALAALVGEQHPHPDHVRACLLELAKEVSRLPASVTVEGEVSQ